MMIGKVGKRLNRVRALPVYSFVWIGQGAKIYVYNRT
jgi:hypothetical protein